MTRGLPTFRSRTQFIVRSWIFAPEKQKVKFSKLDDEFRSFRVSARSFCGYPKTPIKRENSRKLISSNHTLRFRSVHARVKGVDAPTAAGVCLRACYMADLAQKSKGREECL